MSTAQEERVDRGMQCLLDAGWHHALRNVNLLILDIENMERCVLGQIFGDYVRGREILGLTVDQARDRGFTMFSVREEDVRCECKELTRIWRRRILQLRAGDALVMA